MRKSNSIPITNTTTTAALGNGGAGSVRHSIRFSNDANSLEQNRVERQQQQPRQAPPRVNDARWLVGVPSEASSSPMFTNTFDRLLTAGSSVSKTFTSREEELQRLLADERQRSEKRRLNYETLKDEHLRLQKENLALQDEVKQTLEETNYFKDKKKQEIEHLLTEVAGRQKLIDKLEAQLKELEPEELRKKLAEELEEPQRRLQREKNRLEREKEASVHEVKLLRQQIEHLEKEHIDSIERVRLSYEAELNVVKREKEEIRARLVEASQSPDVARLVALSEENARLARRLQAAQTSMETADEQYRAIQKRVEEFVIEHDQKERIYRNEIGTLQDKIESLKKEINSMRHEAVVKKQEIDELLAEIGTLKRLRETSKLEAVVAKNQMVEDLQELKRRYEKQTKLEADIKAGLLDEIQKLKLEIETKNESIDTLEKLVAAKVRELNQKAEEVREEEMDKIAKLMQQKKHLEAKVATLESEMQAQQAEMKSMQAEKQAWSHEKLTMEREMMLVKVKLETQSETIEELEKIKRQHVALHEETTRMRAELYDLQAANREMSRIGHNAREEAARAKDQAEEERRAREELNIAHEKTVTRLARKFNEERLELTDKIASLVRENNQLRMKTGETHRRPVVTPLNAYSRVKARQFSNMADQLNSVLGELKIDDKTKPKVLIKTSGTRTDSLQHENLKRELETLKSRQLQMEKLLSQNKSSKKM